MYFDLDFHFPSSSQIFFLPPYPPNFILFLSLAFKNKNKKQTLHKNKSQNK